MPATLHIEPVAERAERAVRSWTPPYGWHAFGRYEGARDRLVVWLEPPEGVPHEVTMPPTLAPEAIQGRLDRAVVEILHPRRRPAYFGTPWTAR